MDNNTVKLAFYGKGGIGKSTIASNVSAYLAKTGKRVLHIGCDPKADSTRCLTGVKIPTVLNQISVLGEKLKRGDIVFTGVYGVSCIEAGGPQAGMGCAGMGITAMEEELKRLGILDENWDVIIYDVLGDVVCGGFAVPMRKHYVQKVYVVTSSDFMSLYAANNILKCVKSCSSKGQKMFGGLILNHFRGELDRQIAEKFTVKTKTHLLKCIPESDDIKLSDYKKETVIEAFPDSAASEMIGQLAKTMIDGEYSTLTEPMNDEEIDAFCSEMFCIRSTENNVEETKR